MGVFYARGKKVRTVAYLLILVPLVLCVVGGLLNRMRGGWQPYKRLKPHSPNHFLDVLSHDGVGRAIISGPTGLLVGLCMLRVRRGIGIAILFAVLTYLSYFVGWGTYMSVGHDAEQYNSRVGAFDWLLGRVDDGWDYSRRWTLDVAAMSLRGLLQTAPTGAMLLLYGYGWLPMMSGVMMGPLYSIAYLIHSTRPNFGQGTPLGEMMWGMWVWLTLITALTALYRPGSHGRNSLKENSTPPPLTKVTSIILHTWLVVLEVIFVISCVSYGLVKQKDPRNHAQTLVGLVVSTAALIIFHIILVVRQVRFRVKAADPYSFDPVTGGEGEEVFGGLYGSMGANPGADASMEVEASKIYEPNTDGWGSPAARGAATSSVDKADMQMWPVDVDEGARALVRPGTHTPLRLFQQHDRTPEETLAFTRGVHAALCAPPDRAQISTRGGVIASGTSMCVSPMGLLLLLLSAIVAAWWVVWVVLVVVNVVGNSHTFGCVAHVPCSVGPWPTS